MKCEATCQDHMVTSDGTGTRNPDCLTPSPTFLCPYRAAPYQAVVMLSFLGASPALLSTPVTFRRETHQSPARRQKHTLRNQGSSSGENIFGCVSYPIYLRGRKLSGLNFVKNLRTFMTKINKNNYMF